MKKKKHNNTTPLPTSIMICSKDNLESLMRFTCKYRSADHLKPIAAEERRVEEEEKKIREEKERIAKQLAEGEVLHLLNIFHSLLIPMYTLGISTACSTHFRLTLHM